MLKNKSSTKTGWNLDHSYLQLPDAFYTRLDPTPVAAPKLVLLNDPLAMSLGLDPDNLRGEGGAAIFSGNQLPEGSLPLAQAYAGRQFGFFSLLGDGRVHLLGEQITPEGERFDIQLKGSGQTPYSRSGDGRAVLGPMLREYIISEAMHALGIPTTRSLAVVTTGESVYRQTPLPGAILTRVAASHLRVGTFEFAARVQTPDELMSLADYTIQRHFPEVEKGGNPYLRLLQEVIKRQADLIARWQHVGFIHGVMNTDNMALSGETIDYGPCAFMDTYSPDTVFSSIDHQGRYAYGNQPIIGEWNLARFAETLLPLLHPKVPQAVNLAQEALAEYNSLYQESWLDGMVAKLGLFTRESQDEPLVNELLNIMKNYSADYTNTFLALTFEKTGETPMSNAEEFQKWLEKWQERRARQEQSITDSHNLMRDNNPAIIPRNHQVEAALEAAEKENDLSPLHRLLVLLEKPYAHTPEQAKYAAPPEPTSTPYQTF
ncbi:MAG: YdiU family protein, partial [Candidatus Syntrophonatronum acetioxidans]